MSRRLKTEKQKERDKKGAERMKRFEENQFIELPVASKEPLDTITVYQKVEPGEWHTVEIPYKRKDK